jgi:hypothetical protein
MAEQQALTWSQRVALGRAAAGYADSAAALAALNTASTRYVETWFTWRTLQQAAWLGPVRVSQLQRVMTNGMADPALLASCAALASQLIGQPLIDEDAKFLLSDFLERMKGEKGFDFSDAASRQMVQVFGAFTQAGLTPGGLTVEEAGRVIAKATVVDPSPAQNLIGRDATEADLTDAAAAVALEDQLVARDKAMQAAVQKAVTEQNTIRQAVEAGERADVPVFAGIAAE